MILVEEIRPVAASILELISNGVIKVCQVKNVLPWLEVILQADALLTDQATLLMFLMLHEEIRLAWKGLNP